MGAPHGHTPFLHLFIHWEGPEPPLHMGEQLLFQILSPCHGDFIKTTTNIFSCIPSPYNNHLLFMPDIPPASVTPLLGILLSKIWTGSALNLSGWCSSHPPPPPVKGTPPNCWKSWWSSSLLVSVSPGIHMSTGGKVLGAGPEVAEHGPFSCVWGFLLHSWEVTVECCPPRHR